jgi:group I intron endonuclease
MGFIYKITNIITNKCYIGETKKNNPESRWKQHKNTIKNGVGCPALQSAVQKYGIEHFIFDILLICFDEDRFKYEIEYIKKYNSRVPNGYNILEGGAGGGFDGKRHSDETKNKISENLKQKYINNPNLKNEMSERNKIIMNSENVKNKISEGMKNSKKYQKNITDKKVGNFNNNFHTEETKNKIRESVKKYYSKNIGQNINIINHRETMARATGIKIGQYNLNNELINTFISFADASRQTGFPNSTIKKCVKDNITNRGFIWKKE